MARAIVPKAVASRNSIAQAATRSAISTRSSNTGPISAIVEPSTMASPRAVPTIASHLSKST
jgi:hypothetical protein